MKLKVNVNGIDYEREIAADLRLLDFIREELGLKGTKEGCGEGECGGVYHNYGWASCRLLFGNGVSM